MRRMTIEGLRVRPANTGDQPTIVAFRGEQEASRVARLGALVDAREHPALLAEYDGRLVGVLTYVIEGDGCEILTLHAVERWRGVGSRLIEEAERVAAAAGCHRLWLITTNDNVDALRFYQRRGFRLVKLHPGAVDRSREKLKPEIPETGDHGIPLRDELELDKEL